MIIELISLCIALGIISLGVYKGIKNYYMTETQGSQS